MSSHATARRFTVDEYHRMAEAGILSEDDRVELIEGEVLGMEPIGSRHAACVDRLNRIFAAATEDAVVRVQSPVRLDDYSEPEPDVALLRPDPGFYARRHPGPEDVLLVVEVAEASLAYDRDRKMPLYARAGIPEAWLVDLQAGAITVHRGPSADGWAEERAASGDEVLSPREIPAPEVRAGDVLV